MKGLDALLRLLVVLIVAWLLLPIAGKWLGLAMPIACGLLALVVVLRVLLGKGPKL
ncbi:MAG: hypothetical protein QG597_681 [Actinomycetota bacterium]|nr:hypothetical protein [Actinomycetota bacterium]